PISASQCHLSAPVSAAYQCRLSVPSVPPHQCPSVPPHQCSLSVPITAASLAHISEGKKLLIYKML
ncbi:unnamed protein product, partial [Staurois parvus]